MNISRVSSKLESILAKHSLIPSLLGSISSAISSTADTIKSITRIVKNTSNTIKSDLIEFKNNSSNFYLISLYSYCIRIYNNSNHYITNYSLPEILFIFNLTKSLYLSNEQVAALLPISIDKRLFLFSQLSYWVIAGYILTVILISLKIFLVGLKELISLK